MKFSLVLMTLNEIVGCKEIIPRIDKKLFSQLLAIDGGSTDGTIKFLEQNGFEVVIQNKRSKVTPNRPHIDISCAFFDEPALV